jgi:hypothetical protein
MDSAGWTNGSLRWAWERHHNVPSWYIRPPFALPLANFSYRRSLSGIPPTPGGAGDQRVLVPGPEAGGPQGRGVPGVRAGVNLRRADDT